MMSSMSDLVRKMCDVGVHPNALTLTSVVTTIAIVFFHIGGGMHRLVIPVLMMFKWFADVVDGDLARKCQCTSDVGGFLDAFADMLFVAVTLAIFVDAFAGERVSWARLSGPVLLPLCIGISLVPWLVIAARYGWGAVAHHGLFRNGDDTVSKLLRVVTDNTVVTIGVAALAYAVFIIPREAYRQLLRRIGSKIPSILVMVCFGVYFVTRSLSLNEVSNNESSMRTLATGLVMLMPVLLVAYIVAFLPAVAGYTVAFALIVFIASCVAWSCQRLALGGPVRPAKASPTTELR